MNLAVLGEGLDSMTLEVFSTLCFYELLVDCIKCSISEQKFYVK